MNTARDTELLPAAGSATGYCMTVTLEIDPRDEAAFNHLYDTDHLPNMLRIPGVESVVRFRQDGVNEAGNLLYTAVYFLTGAAVVDSADWQRHANSGQWPEFIRPKIKSRVRRGGPIVARMVRNGTASLLSD